MKNTLILIVLACTFCSCGTVQKLQQRHQENKNARLEKRAKSEREKEMKSEREKETAAVTARTVTTTVDTNIHIEGQTLAGTGAMPDTGKSVTFSEGDITTTVGVDSSGQLTVKTTTKARDIPVKKSSTEVYHGSRTTKSKERETSKEKAKGATREKADSTVKRVAVVKEKQVQRPGGGMALWLIAVVVVVLIGLWYKYGR